MVFTYCAEPSYMEMVLGKRDDALSPISFGSIAADPDDTDAASVTSPNRALAGHAPHQSAYARQPAPSQLAASAAAMNADAPSARVAAQPQPPAAAVQVPSAGSVPSASQPAAATAQLSRASTPASQQLGPTPRGMRQGLGGIGRRPGELWHEGPGPAPRAAGVPAVSQLAPTTSRGALHDHPAHQGQDPFSTSRRTQSKQVKMAQVAAQKEDNADLADKLVRCQQKTSRRDQQVMSDGFAGLTRMMLGCAALKQGTSFAEVSAYVSGTDSSATPQPGTDLTPTLGFNTAAATSAAPVTIARHDAVAAYGSNVNAMPVANSHPAATPGSNTMPRQLDMGIAAAPNTVHRATAANVSSWY